MSKKFSFQLIVLLVTVTLFSGHCYCQISEALYNELPPESKPRNKFSITNIEKRKILSAASSFDTKKYKQEFEKFVTDVVIEADNTDSLALKADDLFTVASYYTNRSNDKAIFYYKHLIASLPSQDKYKKDKSSAYLGIATNYYYMQQYGPAFDALHSGVALAESPKDSNMMMFIYVNYSVIYNDLKLTDSALHYGKLALDWHQKSEIGSGSYMHQLISNAVFYSQHYEKYTNMAYLDSAYSLVKRVINEGKKQEENWFGACFYLIGTFDYMRGDYRHALIMFDSSLLPKYNRHSMYFDNFDYKKYMYRGLTLIKMGKYAEGRKLVESVTIPPGRYSQQKIKYKALYEYTKAAGEYKNALTYKELYTLYDDSLSLKEQEGKVFEISQKYNVAQKEVDIAMLQNVNLQYQASRTKTVMGGTIIMLVLGYVALVFYRRYKRHQFQKDLALSEQRKTIAAYMHDHVSSGLAALRFLIVDLKIRSSSLETVAVLEDLEEETNHVYMQSRTVMQHIDKNELVVAEQQLQFNNVLKRLANRFANTGNLNILLEIDEEAIDAFFTRQQHAEMSLVVQEAVANAMKYSHASLLKISLELKDKVFYFDVKDNGIGIQGDTSAGQAGIGIESMRRRLKKLKGEMWITSSSFGTHISATFHLNNQIEI